MDLIALLPADWLPVVTWIVAALIGLFALHGFVSASVATVKGLLGKPTPTDSPAKTRALEIIAKVEPWALNFQRASDALVILQHQLEAESQRRALQAQQAALSEQESIIKLQSQVIADSMRPPAMPSSDADFDTGKQTPTSKRKP